MTAVTEARDTHVREGDFYVFDVKDGENIYEGTLCQLDTNGEIIEATTGTTAVGGFVAEETVLSASSNKVKVRSNVLAKFENGDSITKTSIGDAAYGFDNATVKKTSTGLSVVGYIEQVDSDGVWVRLSSIIVSGLAAANNLSDVGSAATSRSNLGVDRIQVQLVSDLDLVSANAAQFRYVHVGPDMTITRLASVISGALGGGDATITADIGGVAVTNGVITITQSGSAEDDVDAANPTAANTLSEGDVLTLTVGGSQTTASRTASVSMELTFA
jgi:hypothetical protein